MQLTPAIIRDANTGEILTLAYMNDEALQKTIAVAKGQLAQSGPPQIDTPN